MSDAPNNLNSPEAQPYRDKLQELIDGDKQRKDPRKGDRKPFTDAWVGLAKVTGVTSETVDYLFEGVRMAYAEPLHKLALETDAVSVYERFIKTPQAAKNDKGKTLEILLNLLALELITTTVPNPIDFIVRKIPAMTRNKKGKQFNRLTPQIRKHLIHPLVGKTIDPNADIQASSVKTLRNLLSVPLEKMAGAHNARPADVKAIEMLTKWLEDHAASPEDSNVTDVAASPFGVASAGSISATPSKKTNIDSPHDPQPHREGGEAAPDKHPEPAKDNLPDLAVLQAEADSREKADNTSAKAKTQASSVTSEPKRDERKQDAQTKSVGKSRAAKEDSTDDVESHDKEIQDLKKKLAKAKAAKEEANQQIDNLKSLLKQTRKDLTTLRGQRASLSGNYADLQERLEAARAENASLREDLAAAEEMLTMLEERNAHAANVSNQKMLRDLKFEYQDYRDSLDLDMDITLGENMRDQLGNVFEILRANGIDL